MLPVGKIVSLQVGRPQKLVTTAGRAWKSAIVKQPVTGPVELVGENLVGDYQSNRKYHGGPDKAVCFYSAEHYPAWRERLGVEMPCGAFGENVTLQDLTEDRVCIGDTLSIGTALLQVSQPRQPCANVSRRWSAPKLPMWMQDTGWTGFYCRILREGVMAGGDAVTITERPFPEWTIERANRIMYDADTVEAITSLREVSLLSAEWKRILGRRLRP